MTVDQIRAALEPPALEIAKLSEGEQAEALDYVHASTLNFLSSSPEERHFLMEELLDDIRVRAFPDDHPLLLMAKEAMEEHEISRIT